MSTGYSTDTIRGALKSFCDDKSGATFIWADQKGGTPDRPYGTLRLLTDRALSHGDVIDTDQAVVGEELARVITNQNVLSVSIQAYAEPVGVAAWDVLQPIRDALTHPELYSTLSAAGLGPVRVPEITNTSDAVGAQPRQRASMTLDLHVAFNLSTTATIIESVELTADVDDAAGSDVHSDTLDIP